MTLLGGSEARPLTVLVADDSASLRSLVRITLTSQGWTVIETETATGALDLARSQRPDLVLLDITFGDTGPDGLAVCAELKDDPATAPIPVVMLTAHDDPAERRRADAARADAFVAKPFGPLELMQKLRQLMPGTAGTPALGVYLLDAGAVETVQLEDALAEQRTLVERGVPKPLGQVLRERGLVSAPALDRALLEQMHARIAGQRLARGRLLIIDDHAAVREGLRSLILEDDDLEVVGEASNADEGLRLARRHRPDVIVLDAQMPGRSGLELLPDLKRELPSTRLVMFSLDHSLRERALANGATVFVPKDAPMKDILTALQLSAPVEAELRAGTAIPAIERERGARRVVAVLGVALLVYSALFLAIERGVGASAGAFSVLPVVVIGALLGPELGLLGAVLVIVCTSVLWAVTGHQIGEPVLAIGGQGLGLVVLLLMGLGAGSMRLMGLRFDPRRRRAEAIAQVAVALAGVGRHDFLVAFLDGMLRVLGGHAALLFANVAGDVGLVAASRRAAAAAPDRLADLALQTMRSASPLIVDDLPEAQRPLGDVRSALFVPISVAGQEVRGVLVVLHRSRAAFAAPDLVRARMFAQHLWVILRTGPLQMEGSEFSPAREVGL